MKLSCSPRNASTLGRRKIGTTKDTKNTKVGQAGSRGMRVQLRCSPRSACTLDQRKIGTTKDTKSTKVGQAGSRVKSPIVLWRRTSRWTGAAGNTGFEVQLVVRRPFTSNVGQITCQMEQRRDLSASRSAEPVGLGSGIAIQLVPSRSYPCVELCLVVSALTGVGFPGVWCRL